jgi:hypothetical protein
MRRILQKKCFAPAGLQIHRTFIERLISLASKYKFRSPHMPRIRQLQRTWEVHRSLLGVGCYAVSVAEGAAGVCSDVKE